ncbi:hypothetical protein [Rhizobium sp. TRM95796]|uniref:hypothetical protein n=1 Tax=Rhizobium sp. TRM95796 TaxID=2979862 RepID=UPI0039924C6C
MASVRGASARRQLYDPRRRIDLQRIGGLAGLVVGIGGGDRDGAVTVTPAFEQLACKSFAQSISKPTIQGESKRNLIYERVMKIDKHRQIRNTGDRSASMLQF